MIFLIDDLMKKILLYILAAAIPVLTVGCEKPEEKGEGGGDKTPQEYFWHFSVLLVSNKNESCHSRGRTL